MVYGARWAYHIEGLPCPWPENDNVWSDLEKRQEAIILFLTSSHYVDTTLHMSNAYEIKQTAAGFVVVKISTGLESHAMSFNAARRVLAALIKNPGPRP